MCIAKAGAIKAENGTIKAIGRILGRTCHVRDLKAAKKLV